MWYDENGLLFCSLPLPPKKGYTRMRKTSQIQIVGHSTKYPTSISQSCQCQQKQSLENRHSIENLKETQQLDYVVSWLGSWDRKRPLSKN